MGSEPLAFFFAIAAGLVELTAQLGSNLALTLGCLVGGALGGLGGSGIESGGAGVLAGLVKLGVTLREFVSVFCLSRRQLLVCPGYRGLGVGPDLGDLGLGLFAQTRRPGDRVFGQRIGFLAFALGGPCAFVGQSGGPFSGCAASLGLGDLGERIAVCILNLCARGLDIAGGVQLDYQVI
ncbi:hypothetical protein [Mycobacterium persicum]|uniref:hypothetical protein n=1 Tax=Mycobacterium persicum TaxID=1487726 RepID=UPI00160531FE|nr:hypothetical protein [Mycobacterium persicum]